MVVLMTGENSNGHKRRCDKRCYDAHGKNCRCICGAVHHGIGLAAAIVNIESTAEKLAAKIENPAQSIML